MFRLYWDNGKSQEPTIVHLCYIGIMEKKMETNIVYWSYILQVESRCDLRLLQVETVWHLFLGSSGRSCRQGTVIGVLVRLYTFATALSKSCGPLILHFFGAKLEFPEAVHISQTILSVGSVNCKM